MIKLATIAGSDASGGAGLEADLKTFQEYGVYGMAAVTVIATMNPDKEWGHEVFPLDEQAIRAQLETIFKGIGVNAAKTGMLATNYAVELSAELFIISPSEGDYNIFFEVCLEAKKFNYPSLNSKTLSQRAKDFLRWVIKRIIE